tara:strand:+ start:1820 stop:2353 length:534 start_codon:yes stop_codon:yes gene_type:complete
MLPRKKSYHRHHIIPKHAGGTDDDDNIIYLTPEEHAKAHLELYEKHGKYEDAQAYNSLKKYWNESRTIDGYKQSEKHIRKRIENTDYAKISDKLKGRISPTKGMKFDYKPKPKISEALRGKSKSNETKEKISKSLLGKEASNKIDSYCIFCRKRVQPSRIDRHGYGKRECTNGINVI